MMHNAMFLAGIFGPYLLILGVWMLFYHDNVTKMVTSAKNTPAVFCLGGAINLLLGLTVLTQFNVWTWTLSVLLTLFGWWMLARGLMVFFLPQLLIKMTMSGKCSKMCGIIPLVWGFFLSWFAFWSV